MGVAEAYQRKPLCPRLFAGVLDKDLHRSSLEHLHRTKMKWKQCINSCYLPAPTKFGRNWKLSPRAAVKKKQPAAVLFYNDEGITSESDARNPEHRGSSHKPESCREGRGLRGSLERKLRTKSSHPSSSWQAI